MAGNMCLVQCMERERLVDSRFVFRIWDYEVNYGDFICVTCISYVEQWKILNLQLGYKFG